jgi:hypothetical protein
VSAGRHRYRERIEPAGVHALLLPHLRCYLAPILGSAALATVTTKERV